MPLYTNIDRLHSNRNQLCPGLIVVIMATFLGGFFVRWRSPKSNTKTIKDEAIRRKKEEEITADLICPITHDLPFDPVTAKDGRVYERDAIEEHISRSQQNGRSFRSPITNESMEPLLLPSPQIKSLIETLIANGSITGEMASSYKQKKQAKVHVDRLLNKARNGDADAMYDAYVNYKSGCNHFKKDNREAYRFLKNAYAAGNVEATAVLGLCFCTGKVENFVVPKNETKGMVLIALAAQAGSDYAAYLLGTHFASGKYGLPVDVEEAIHWLEVSLNRDCPHQHMTEHYSRKANSVLADLKNSINEDNVLPGESFFTTISE